MDKKASGALLEQLRKDKVALPQSIIRFAAVVREGQGQLVLEVGHPGEIADTKKYDLRWLLNSGYAKFCMEEKNGLVILLEQIEAKRARKDRTLEELFVVP